MPMSHILSCDRCGLQWRWLQMKAREPLPSCPNVNCGHEEVTKELAAPGLNRGAEQSFTTKIPETRAGREKFAYEMAESMGATNMRDNQREGDIAAMPVPDPVVKAPNGREIKVPVGYMPAGSNPEAIAGSIASMVGGAGGAAINAPAMRVLGGMKRRG